MERASGTAQLSQRMDVAKDVSHLVVLARHSQPSIQDLQWICIQVELFTLDNLRITRLVRVVARKEYSPKGDTVHVLLVIFLQECILTTLYLVPLALSSSTG